MTSQEQQLIDGLIQRVNSTNLTDKDPEAEQYLQKGFSGNPNATYILSQTVLVQQYALEQAQKQLADLRQQLTQSQQAPAPQKHGGFLSSIFGSGDPEPQQQQRTSAPPPPPAYQPVPPQQGYPQQGYPQQGYAPQVASGGGFGQGGGFLRGAAQTAAGVAAGALAFEGVESLLHGFGNNMVGGERGFDAGAPREEVVNNYYGDGNDRDSGDRDTNDRGFTGADQDSNNNDPGSNMFTDSDSSDSSDDQGNFDDNSGSDFDSGMDDGSTDMGSDDSSF